MSGFQQQVNLYPAPAEAGDFWGTNPRASVLGGEHQWVSPLEGLIVGNFAWASVDENRLSQSYLPGAQIGFLRRDNNAIITEFLAEAVYTVLQGLPVTLFSEGDFWARFAAGATPGQRVFAHPGTGAPVAGPLTGVNVASVTASAGFTGTASMGASFTVVIATNVATLSAVTGYVTAGDIVTSANIAGLAIGAQLTGTPGGAGTYTFVHADVASEAGTSTSTVLNVTAVTRGALAIGSVVTGGGLAVNSTVTAIIAGTGGVGRYTLSGAPQSSASGAKAANTAVLDVTAIGTGPLNVGDVIAGTGVTAGTQITEQLTGTPGGIGTYQLSVAQNFASTAVTVGGILTPWYVDSVAAAGELAKISSWG